MKKLNKRILVWFLTLAMLIPVLSAAAAPAFAATTSGNLKNVDPELITGLIAPCEEATINMENGGGIRFATNINLKKLEDLKAFCKKRRIELITIGTLIAPVDYIQEAGGFSKEKLDALEYKTPYLDITCNSEIFYKGERFITDGYDEQFTASLMNIKLNNRDRDFAAIGYIQLTLAQGFYTIYSYDYEDMNLVKKYATSIADLAAKELEKDTWTDDERAMIGDLAAKADEVEITSDEVADILTTRNQVFFTYTKGSTAFYNRITYDGANGWRLQSNADGYNYFRDISAGQSLAMYLDEGFKDITMPLTVVQEEGKLIIKAEGTDTKAVLSYDSFKLDFCNAAGESLYNVTNIRAQDGGKIAMKGKMNKTDAVYGGGERFDEANKRGQTMSLYISDAYDAKAGGTYVAVPLFSTSRGGGMFINRYDPITISFPYQNMEGEWSMTITSELVDCYFYATGNIADVLQAYTDITGHASLPEEWAQGYLVCRFQPDFTSLNGAQGGADGVIWYYNIEDIPNYEKLAYSMRYKLTEDTVSELVNGDTLTSSTGGSTYYTYIIEGADEDKNGNGKTGETYFWDSKAQKSYKTFAELPHKNSCHYLRTLYLKVGADVPHKKTLTYGSIRYHYIEEKDNEDLNYNGITGEKYFIRITAKNAPAGAGVVYIVNSLIAAGMRPDGVILEGVNWYDSYSNTATKGNLRNFVTYLNEQNIKTILYSYMGWTQGGMGKNYNADYVLSANLYEFDEETGKAKLDVDGNPIFLEKITYLPKADRTDNPDTSSESKQYYLDITNPDAVEWYMNNVWNALIDLGIDGVKFDFCESLPNEGKLKIGSKTVYLEYNWHNPVMFTGTEAHNAYPSYYISAFYKAMEEKASKREGDTGFVVLTRGGGIGAQRNPYLWAGDQTRRFVTLSTQLSAVINSGISGIPFMSYDMAGYAYYKSGYHYYGGQTTYLPAEAGGEMYLPDGNAAEQYESEIFIRALQFTVFGNLIQTHGDVRNVYQMTQEVEDLSALYNALHGELSDYLQELSKIACDTGMPMIRHMILEYQNDANVADIDDQFMYGDALLVAPILNCSMKKEGDYNVLEYAATITRDVYLPAGEWIDLNTGETIVSEGQTITVSANLAQIPVYLNTASAYAEQMQEIFAGDTWQAILAYASQLADAQ